MNIFHSHIWKSLIIVTNVVILFIVSGCSTVKNHYRDDFWGTDKLYHFTASGIIGAGTTAIAKNNGATVDDAPVIGISVAVGFGAGKEFYDLTIKETYWSLKDMLWDLIGGSVGSYAVSKCE